MTFYDIYIIYVAFIKYFQYGNRNEISASGIRLINLYFNNNCKKLIVLKKKRTY